MCPACLSTFALIAASAVSASGLAAVVGKVRMKDATQAPSDDAPAARPANEEELP